jgi:hypothetical protein
MIGELAKMVGMSIAADFLKERIFPSQPAQGLGPGNLPGRVPQTQAVRPPTPEEELDRTLVLEPNLDPETRRGVILLLLHGSADDLDTATVELVRNGALLSAQYCAQRGFEIRAFEAHQRAIAEAQEAERTKAEHDKAQRLAAAKKEVVDYGIQRAREVLAGGNPLVSHPQPIEPVQPVQAAPQHPADAHVADLLSSDPARRTISDLDAEVAFVKNLPRPRPEEVQFKQTVQTFTKEENEERERQEKLEAAPAYVNGAAPESPTIDLTDDTLS